MYSDIYCLHVPLPEDIEKLKWHGDFERALRVIDKRLEKDIPMALKKRLILEKEILSRIPGEYPYSWTDALALLQERVRDFSESELINMWEENAAEWIYIDGQVHFKDDFFSNMVKTRPWFRERLIFPDDRGSDEEGKIRDEVIRKMKSQGSVSYRIHLKSTLELAETAERPGEKIKVYLPIPVEYAQVRNFRLLEVAVQGKEGCRPAREDEYTVADPEYPQRTVCIHTAHQPGQTYSIEFSYETHMKYQILEADRVSDVQPSFYLQEEFPHIRFTAYLREVTREVVGQEMNPLLKAQKIYEYITSHVMYSFVRSYITIPDIPEYVASGWKGDCGFQALLFITMCRIAGIPARWQSGLYVTPISAGSHDWAQFYIAPYGWLFADCSFGGTAFREGDETRRRFYFGNLDPFRMPAVSQFQQPFCPPMKWIRNDPYDNQRGEGEYADRSLRPGEYETKHRVIECREIRWETATKRLDDVR